MTLDDRDRPGARPDAGDRAPRRYQDELRAIGAWLDARGYREIRVIERPNGLLVQGRPGGDDPTVPFETMIFDEARLRHLLTAARRDRGTIDPASDGGRRPPLTIVPLDSVRQADRPSDPDPGRT